MSEKRVRPLRTMLYEVENVHFLGRAPDFCGQRESIALRYGKLLPVLYCMLQFISNVSEAALPAIPYSTPTVRATILKGSMFPFRAVNTSTSDSGILLGTRGAMFCLLEPSSVSMFHSWPSDT